MKNMLILVSIAILTLFVISACSQDAGQAAKAVGGAQAKSLDGNDSNDTGGNDTGGNESSFCGDGNVDPGEECEPGSFPYSLCTDYYETAIGGTLSCDGTCRIDDSNCIFNDGNDTGGNETNDTGGNETGGNETGGNETTVCGNGVVEAGEECDDGNSNNNDACTNNCLKNNPPSGGSPVFAKQQINQE